MMKKRAYASVAAVTLLILAIYASAGLQSHSNILFAVIDGSQEVPPVASPVSGNGTFVIDTVANTLEFDILISGLQNAEIAAHIHGPAGSGATAPVLFPLPLGNAKKGVWNYPEANEADILGGRTYVNVHTGPFPNGEIRGQIVSAG